MSPLATIRRIVAYAESMFRYNARLLIAVLVALIACTSSAPALASPVASRGVLTTDLTLYVRSDGNDGNDCLSDSAGGACREWQAAVDRVAALDLGNRTVTIQGGNEGSAKTWTAPIRVPTLVGGGLLRFSGSPTPTYTTLNVANGPVFDFNNTVTLVTMKNMTIVGNGGGSGAIQISWNSIGIIESGVIFGPAFNAHIYVHDSQATALILSANYTIAGGAFAAHVYVNGGMAFIEASHITFENEPPFAGAFVAALNGGKIQVIGLTSTGVSHGAKFAAGAGGIINTFGGGLNYLPGDSPGVVGSGGIYGSLTPGDVVAQRMKGSTR